MCEERKLFEEAGARKKENFVMNHFSSFTKSDAHSSNRLIFVEAGESPRHTTKSAEIYEQMFSFAGVGNLSISDRFRS